MAPAVTAPVPAGTGTASVGAGLESPVDAGTELAASMGVELESPVDAAEEVADVAPCIGPVAATTPPVSAGSLAGISSSADGGPL